ncbi:DUF416 domain-containing protein [Aliidiomarina taiwanensis]|uniref:DUF416 domain-containing protein n=1 Tax=Aliidiomarina taiwanensis TaxID=946228 RepID=A0A432X764_9GAMM|nr:YjaG family protein [Aliidiomarina taiwanensis]RUO42688.1 DUF416 domain-containing protein [Aliidiomarina taiwanensis]
MATADIERKAAALENDAQAVFAAYLCERMLPNYRLFSEQASTGDSKVLRGMLDAIWDKLTTGKGAGWERWQEKLEAVTPSESEHDVLGVYPAIAACTALSCLAQGFSERDAQCFLDVARVSKGSVAHYLELGECAQIEDANSRAAAVAEHELMAYEVAVQDAMLDFLRAEPRIHRELIRDVRQIAREEGHSNLGL